MTKTEFTHRHPAIAMLLASILAVSSSTMLINRIEAAGTISVSITGFAFNPQNATVPRGYTVVWTNNDPVIHTLWFVNISDQSTYLLSDPINPGATWSHTFNDLVDLQYYDFNRLWISGSLRISKAVGGILAPVNKFALLAPYIGLASTILAATVASTVYVKRVKRRKEKQ
jgi:plastocyanin